MKIWHHALEDAPYRSGPTVVTLGNFDGVHMGHRALLTAAVQRAKERGMPAAVVTFDPHPAVVVATHRKPLLLSTLTQRLAVFEALGVDIAWVIPFNRTVSQLSAQLFLATLDKVLEPVELHVGRSFRFGRERLGDMVVLEEWGMTSGCRIQSYAFKAHDDGVLSSTRIRGVLQQGDVDEAARLLGQPFVLTGVVVEGDRRGRHLGFPTANLQWDQEQIPGAGVYVTEVRGARLGQAHLGLTNVGEKPTFQGTTTSVETFLPDFEGDLYGTRLELAFLHRIRGEQRFDGVDALREQIAQDVTAGQAWWSVNRG
ncbi:MAG: bifunctional riboflavin kinase/FAD synthetase [Holophaga sp.]|nr:bifunctional riboflavin kinase/FAD synthetase [Holophaga sp.]